MTVKFHPDTDILLDYAAGGLSPALCVSVSTHLHFCDVCRVKNEQLSNIGGNLLDTSEPAALSEDSFEVLMAKLDAMSSPSATLASTPEVTREHSDEVKSLPETVQNLIQDYAPNWKFLSPSLRVARLAVGEERYELALHKIKAGGTTPDHDHRGLEVTVVLQGSFSDEAGVYHEGDFLVREPGQVHRPTASQNESCICLSVLEAPIRLVGGVKRMLNPFFSTTPQ